MSTEPNQRDGEAGRDALPYPASLCHGCAAPPQYVRTRTSTFILCPIAPEKYPRQPVIACAYFRPAEGGTRG